MKKYVFAVLAAAFLLPILEIGHNSLITEAYIIIFLLGFLASLGMLIVLCHQTVSHVLMDKFLEKKEKRNAEAVEDLLLWLGMHDIDFLEENVMLTPDYYQARHDLDEAYSNLRLLPQRIEACKKGVDEIDDGWALEEIPEFNNVDLRTEESSEAIDYKRDRDLRAWLLESLREEIAQLEKADIAELVLTVWKYQAQLGEIAGRPLPPMKLVDAPLAEDLVYLQEEKVVRLHSRDEIARAFGVESEDVVVRLRDKRDLAISFGVRPKDMARVRVV